MATPDARGRQSRCAASGRQDRHRRVEDEEAGDRERPIWTGAWWSKAEDLPEGAAPKVRVWRSPNGHRIVVDDDADELRIVHGSGAEIVLSEDGIRLSKGNASIEISDSKVTVNGGALEVE